MRKMMAFVLLASLCSAAGCNQPRNFGSSCTVETVNGTVETVRVRFPQCSEGLRVTRRDEMDRLIASLEILMIDLKAARNQMQTVEPPLATDKP